MKEMDHEKFKPPKMVWLGFNHGVIQISWMQKNWKLLCIITWGNWSWKNHGKGFIEVIQQLPTFLDKSQNLKIITCGRRKSIMRNLKLQTGFGSISGFNIQISWLGDNFRIITCGRKSIMQQKLEVPLWPRSMNPNSWPLYMISLVPMTKRSSESINLNLFRIELSESGIGHPSQSKNSAQKWW